MMFVRVDEAIAITRPIEVVFDEVADLKQWARSRTGVRFVGGATLSEGARFRIESQQGQGVRETEGVITAFDRPHRFGARAPTEPFGIEWHALLDGDAALTTITISASLSPGRWVFGIPMLLGRPLFARAIRKVLRQRLEELKADLERPNQSD